MVARGAAAAMLAAAGAVQAAQPQGVFPSTTKEKDIRLNGGLIDAALMEAEGRVEVYHNGAWGTVCDHKWTIKDATVACNQLGYLYGTTTWVAKGKTPKSLYGQGTGPIWLSDVACSGEETVLADCASFGWGVTGNCDHSSNDAGAYCYNTDVTPLQPAAPLVGNETTYAMCHSSCDCYPCGDKGYPQVTATAGFLSCNPLDLVKSYCGPDLGSHGDGCYTLAEATCNCNTGKVECSPPSPPSPPGNTIRLAGEGVSNQTMPMSGRLEILHDGVWGTFCDNGWTKKNAQVACQQLGFLHGTTTWDALRKKPSRLYGEGAGPIWLDHVKCDGLETVISDCMNDGWLVASCEHKDEAGVFCSNSPFPPDPPLPPRPPPYSPGLAPAPPPPSPPLVPKQQEKMMVPVPGLYETETVTTPEGDELRITNEGPMPTSPRYKAAVATKDKKLELAKAMSDAGNFTAFAKKGETNETTSLASVNIVPPIGKTGAQKPLTPASAA